MNNIMDLNFPSIDIQEIFRLNTTVSVVRTADEGDAHSISKSAVLKSYDLHDFVKLDGETPSHFFSMLFGCYDVEESNYIRWHLQETRLIHKALTFTYTYTKILNQSIRVIKKDLLYVSSTGGIPNITSAQIVGTDTYLNTIDFVNEYGVFTGWIECTSKVSLRNNFTVSEASLSPFRVKLNEDSKFVLCCNTQETIHTSSINLALNGDNWDCKIFIIAKDHPYFSFKPEYKTLELPSVYKPFYMRSLVLVDNNTFITRAVGNIFNGIGYKGESEYNVGTLSIGVNKANHNIDITREKPTLLCNYDESISSFTTSEGSREYLDNAVTDLSNIDVTINMTELAPEEVNAFVPNSISYSNFVSFYKIVYTTGITDTNRYEILLNRNSFTGTSSSNVKYYFVSQHFWNKFIENDGVYDFKEIIECNKLQTYELQPNFADIKNETFLSIYDTICFPSLEHYYMAHSYTDPGGQHMYEDPSNESYIIEINVDEIMNLDIGTSKACVFFDKSVTPGVYFPWFIIGIIDPVIESINNNSYSGIHFFIEPRINMPLLPPHKDFVTIMTIAKPSNING